MVLPTVPRPSFRRRRLVAPTKAGATDDQPVTTQKPAGTDGTSQGLRHTRTAGAERRVKLLADHGIVCSMSRSGNVWDDAAMESFFSSMKSERTARKIYRTRDEAKADVFDYIECFYNAKRRHSTIGYKSPMEFEMKAGLA